MSAETDKVEDTLRQYGAAGNAGDFDTWMSLWSADGKALTLYERQPDGALRIAYDSFNANAPMSDRYA